MRISEHRLNVRARIEPIYMSADDYIRVRNMEREHSRELGFEILILLVVMFLGTMVVWITSRIMDKYL